MTRQRLKDIAQLSRPRARRALGQFLVEGARSVASAVEAGAPIVEVLVAHDASGEAAAAAARAERAGVPVWPVAARDLDRVGDARTSQGVLAVAASVVRESLDGVEGPVLLLDGVQDPGNVGGMVRTAAWFGAAAVVADAASADFETPKAARASMGGLWDLRLVRVPALAPVLDRLEAGVEVWGADLDGTPVGGWAPARGAALVVGSEARGLSEPVRRRLAGRVSIPGAGPGRARGVESLNVAVAAGVLLARWLGEG